MSVHVDQSSSELKKNKKTTLDKEEVSNIFHVDHREIIHKIYMNNRFISRPYIQINDGNTAVKFWIFFFSFLLLSTWAYGHITLQHRLPYDQRS